MMSEICVSHLKSNVAAAELVSALDEIFMKLRFNLRKSADIIVKPNIATAKVGCGVTTHPEVLEGILAFLRRNGYENVRVAESSWKGCRTERAFNTYKLHHICSKYGYEALNLEGRPYETRNGIRIFSDVLECDYIINVPVLKEHRMAKVSLGMKNMKGCIPDIEKVRFHVAGLHDHIFKLNSVMTPNLTIMDAICGLRGGPFSGEIFNVGMIIASYDVVALDCFACSLLGIQPERVKHIRKAFETGLGARKYEIV